MFRENVEIHTVWTEFLAQSVLELFLPLAVLSWSQEWHEQGSKVWEPEASQAFGSSPPQPAPTAAFTLLFWSWKIGWAAWNLPTSDLLHWFQQNPDIYIFSFCWIEDAENSSWFTSDWMDLAEWFNSSHAAGCRKILSHFTERMFLLSFLVITYLHELAQLGGSGGSCVAPSVCVSYQLILRPD